MINGTEQDKPPPILVRFGHPTERNLLLPFSSNLRKGIEIDKNVPKIYLKKHRELKRKAWKLKIVHNVQAQVVFDGFKMILRYKKKDDGVTKFNYNIHSEWFPNPSDLTSSLSSVTNRDANKHDTPEIDLSDDAECNRILIVNNVCESVTASTVKDAFGSYFSKNDFEVIEDINFKAKGTVLIICKEWAGCKLLANNYSQTKLLGKDLRFILYSDIDPNA